MNHGESLQFFSSSSSKSVGYEPRLQRSKYPEDLRTQGTASLCPYMNDALGVWFIVSTHVCWVLRKTSASRA